MKVRFSVARLLVVIAICGVGFAALASPSPLLASTLFAVALGSLPVALLNAIYSRGRPRAVWGGFLVWGATYLTATQGPWFRDECGPSKATNAMLNEIYVWTEPYRLDRELARTGKLHLVHPETFRRIGHSFLTLLFAALGGLCVQSRYKGKP